MIFLLFYDNVASERELMETIVERMDYLWLCDPVNSETIFWVKWLTHWFVVFVFGWW